MEVRWLKQEGAEEAIVVFGGWAIGPEVFDHLKGPEDILFVSGYSDLRADLPDLSSYRRVRLLAWSFGVASYAHWQQGRADPFAAKVAVNGSLQPVSRAAGIAPLTFRKTAENLSLDSYQQFLTRAFGVPQPARMLDVEARRAELIAVEQRGDAPRLPFDRVWISEDDRIFPPASLSRAWAGLPVRRIKAPHVPFAHFSAWEELFQ
ncbi:pimeloyl-ACP methyl esterase BioG family protein [Cribrihabitans neustonicus]|uniref:pimeloyl-ACP methyl esterase BioG family protein n=1 Tax=Cribrihabitans neustonicus TaxID=1429085 RepID=UPI003B59E720